MNRSKDFSSLLQMARPKGEIHPPTEHQHQVRLVSWFRETYPDKRIFAIPNGGARGGDELSARIAGKQLKLEGVDPGVPDLMIPHLHMFIEMKRKGGRIPPSQASYIDYLASCGYKVVVCYSFEEAKNAIISESAA